MKKIVVLGSGLVGGPMALDLARDRNFKVTAVDVSAQALARVKKVRASRPSRRTCRMPPRSRRSSPARIWSSAPCLATWDTGR